MHSDGLKAQVFDLTTQVKKGNSYSTYPVERKNGFSRSKDATFPATQCSSSFAYVALNDAQFPSSSGCDWRGWIFGILLKLKVFVIRPRRDSAAGYR